MADPFYVVTHERGLGGQQLPTWSDRGAPAIQFEDSPPALERVEVEGVPGAFMLLDLLSPAEAQQFIEVAERLGFHPDSPVSLSRSIRHNDNLNWVVSEAIDAELWARSAPAIPERIQGQVARGLNARFRFYRYGPGDYFSPHTDGAWPGSRVVDGRLVRQHDRTLYSQYTYLILLNEDYEGGETEFMVSHDDPSRAPRRGEAIQRLRVRTPAGAALCFPHGMHPQHCVHASTPITRGTKYIIRTDILFGPQLTTQEPLQ